MHTKLQVMTSNTASGSIYIISMYMYMYMYFYTHTYLGQSWPYCSWLFLQNRVILVILVTPDYSRSAERSDRISCRVWLDGWLLNVGSDILQYKIIQYQNRHMTYWKRCYDTVEQTTKWYHIEIIEVYDRNNPIYSELIYHNVRTNFILYCMLYTCISIYHDIALANLLPVLGHGRRHTEVVAAIHYSTVESSICSIVYWTILYSILKC